MGRGRIIIIGAGLSGTAMAAHLVRARHPQAGEIVVVERRRAFGPGLAYDVRDPAYVLNVRANRLSLFPDQPQDFARSIAAGDDAFVSRSTFGAYLRNRFAAARRARWLGGFQAVRDEAIACRAAGARWRVEFANRPPMEADAVVLALGNPAPKRIGVLEDAGIELISPWEGRTLARAPAGDALLIGTGLTMIDVALTLARRRRGVIYALSHRGLLPRTHANAMASRADEPDLPQPLSQALHELRRRARAARARGEPWQWTLERLRPRTQALWRRLTAEEQARFLRHARPWWDVHRHRAAPQVAERIAALRSEGRLRVLTGEIVEASCRGRMVEVHHRQRGERSRHRVQAAFVVNCTGPDLDPRRSPEPLVRQLLGDGLARAHPTGLGFDIREDGALIGAEGAPREGLYLIGPMTMGAFWESTAAPEITAAAAALARRLADRVSQPHE